MSIVSDFAMLIFSCGFLALIFAIVYKFFKRF